METTNVSILRKNHILNGFELFLGATLSVHVTTPCVNKDSACRLLVILCKRRDILLLQNMFHRNAFIAVSMHLLVSVSGSIPLFVFPCTCVCRPSPAVDFERNVRYNYLSGFQSIFQIPCLNLQCEYYRSLRHLFIFPLLYHSKLMKISLKRKY